MKGIELPVNVLVIVAIAVIVLLGMLTLFMGGFGGFAGTQEQTTAWSKACGSVLSNCAGSHSSDGVTTIKIGDAQVSTFGGLCGNLGKYDNTKVSFTPSATGGSFGISTATTSLASADVGRTDLNGCNRACGCS